MILVILCISITLQLIAAIIAFSLIKKTGRIYAWLFIAAAILLMAFRRTISLTNILSTNNYNGDLTAESIALIISALLIIGIWRIGKVFEQINKLQSEAKGELQKCNEVEQELRESEERYRGLFNNANEGILVSESNTMKIVFANPAICEMLGYSTDELRQLTVSELHPPEYRDFVIDDFKAKVGGEKPISFNVPCLCKNGSIVYADIKTSNYKYKDNDYILGFFENVTEKQKAEEEQLRLQNLEKLGNVAAGIAHEFNNLLTGIYGNIEIAKFELSREHPAIESLQKAQDTMEVTRKLTSELLTFAKGGAPVIKTVPTAQLIQEAVNSALADSNIEARLEIPNNIWPVKADKEQIIQVFSSLANNTIDAMPQGGTFYIKAENLTSSANENKNTNFVKITVKDNGPGIPLNIINKIFDPFFTTKQTGKGLGLSLVHSIIKKHNGHVTVSAKPEEGTIFTLLLPAVTSSVKREKTISKAEDSDSNEKGNFKVLFMDDEEMLRKLSTEMLKVLGYSVETAKNGEEAVDKCFQSVENNSPFDIVILDLIVSNGAGAKEVIEDILDILPNTKVIVTSGYASDPIMIDYEEYGFSGSLKKPFKLESLKEEISRITSQTTINS